MTETPASKSSSSPTEPLGAASETEPRSYAGPFAKGCGCVTVALALGLGVAFVGKGEIEIWGAALVGVIFLVLVMGSSGLVGFWNK